MKKLLSSLTVIAALCGATPAAFAHADIITADGWTKTTDRYLSGQLDQRLLDLGSNLQTGQHVEAVYKLIANGVKRHCYYTMLARGEDVTPCGYSPSHR